MATIVGNPHGFFSYTSGRWIWDEEDQLRERYREFDILELQKVAMESASAESCVRMEKLGEGSYKKFFLLTMANGKAVAARIPHPNAGPVVLTTASEIATMDFLREILQVPVPKVLAWNATVNFANRVGAEYIIMEHAPGKNLADYRADMSLELKFSGYGCLYFRNNAPPGSHPAMVKGDGLSPELKESIAGQFSIGPVVNTVLA
ncbi:hypothetical protein KXX19_003043 [Aspergillus fumigatus]|nr:hypothetical protein KXX19_003043 [Aspergillus fumigatus]